MAAIHDRRIDGRRCYILVSVSKELKRAVITESKRLGLSASEFTRRALHARPPEFEVYPQQSSTGFSADARLWIEMPRASKRAIIKRCVNGETMSSLVRRALNDYFFNLKRGES